MEDSHSNIGVTCWLELSGIVEKGIFPGITLTFQKLLGLPGSYFTCAGLALPFQVNLPFQVLHSYVFTRPGVAGAVLQTPL